MQQRDGEERVAVREGVVRGKEDRQVPQRVPAVGEPDLDPADDPHLEQCVAGVARDVGAHAREVRVGEQDRDQREGGEQARGRGRVSPAGGRRVRVSGRRIGRRIGRGGPGVGRSFDLAAHGARLPAWAQGPAVHRGRSRVGTRPYSVAGGWRPIRRLTDAKRRHARTPLQAGREPPIDRGGDTRDFARIALPHQNRTRS